MTVFHNRRLKAYYSKAAYILDSPAATGYAPPSGAAAEDAAAAGGAAARRLGRLGSVDGRDCVCLTITVFTHRSSVLAACGNCCHLKMIQILGW